ncbi:MFS transporter [Azospirillum melinis]|uniref:MFS transporter n=1 Tax=Azospirillum melinis TaxID=328839 RepID=A0ABX2K531_9PROT|nr:MFS transporter [Azospirillum melinis]MBP2305311.1 MFS family permease [Azospirillum melinis]NUA97777.1 MFS transporter [Azospirillum melinis]
MSLIQPIVPLLLAVFLMMGGTGALTTIVSVRLDAAGASPILLGALTAAYYLGVTVGSTQAFRLVGQVGHIRAFSASATVLVAATLGHTLGSDPAAWIALRLVEGCCMAGLFVCIESWLNQSATSATRGQILALYMIALYGAQGVGQYLMVIDDPHGFKQFVIVSILVSLALVPVALSRTAPPLLQKLESIRIGHLYRASPLGFAGTVISGLVVGAFYGLGPVYVRHLGYDLGQSATFISAAIIGGMLLQWPFGKLSDLIDRRLVVVGLFAALAVISIGMTMLPQGGFGPLLAGISLFGGIIFAIYPICVSHTNDFLTPAEMVPASGGMVLGFSMGAIAGPFLASLVMAVFEQDGLFLFTALVAGIALAFALWRMTVRPPVPLEQRLPFLPQAPIPGPLDGVTPGMEKSGNDIGEEAPDAEPSRL